MTAPLLLLALFVLLSAFCFASAAALASPAGARVPYGPASRPQRTRATLRVGGVATAAVAATIAARAAFDVYGAGGAALAAGTTVLALLFLGLALPRRLIARHEAARARVSAPVVRLLSLLLYPVVWPLERLTARSAARGVEPPPPPEAHGHRVSERAASLEERCAWDVMTPRVQVFAWPAELRLAELAPQLRDVRYSRVPVFERSIDQIVGVLYLRDAYQALLAGQRDVQLRELAREPFLVPGSIPLARLLGDFQTRRIHMGIVMDEYGGTDGVVTLEDVLEELVGEIADETDPEEQPIVRLSRSEVVVEGRADLREINHFFNTRFPQLEHRSLNGYLLDELGHVPRPGEELEREGVLIRVLQASETQVLRAVLVRPAPGGEPAAPPQGRLP